MKRAILTFDYEMFLGEDTGTLNKCVIDPAKRILDVLTKNKARSIFFADAAWLLFMKQNLPTEYFKIAGQLRDIQSAGSTIELHLHPQWLDAVITSKKISFKKGSRYKVHSLSDSEIEILFRDSISLLHEITGDTVSCYRAGGFCIDPFSKLKKVFDQHHILYDFSVVPGMILKGSDEYGYNFRTIRKISPYRFELDVKCKEPMGRFTEVPVSTYWHNPLYTIFKMAKDNIKDKEISGDGKGIYTVHDPFRSVFHKMFHMVKTPLSIDDTPPGFFRYILNSHFICNSLIVLIAHPKTLSNQSVQNLDFISRNYLTLNSRDLSLVCK